MSVFALISGTLFRSVESRMSKNGKPFVTATVRIKDGGGSQFIRIVAFSETVQAELLRLRDGDSLSLQGALKAEIYDKDGEHRISLSIVADQVLALRQPPKERKTKAPVPAQQDTRSRQPRCAGSWAPGLPTTSRFEGARYERDAERRPGRISERFLCLYADAHLHFHAIA